MIFNLCILPNFINNDAKIITRDNVELFYHFLFICIPNSECIMKMNDEDKRVRIKYA